MVGKVIYYVFFLIEVHTRRVHIAGMTTNPKGLWMVQADRSLCMSLEDQGKKTWLGGLLELCWKAS